MDALTPAERRGALMVVLLLALGAGYDLWRATRPLPLGSTLAAPVAEPPGAPGPAAGASSPGAATRSGDAPGAAPAVDLNRASARELDALPGIGPVLAARIVAHRQRHGPFASREELLAVRGIGPRLLARLGAQVRVEPDRAPDRSDTLRRAP